MKSNDYLKKLKVNVSKLYTYKVWTSEKMLSFQLLPKRTYNEALAKETVVGLVTCISVELHTIWIV